LFLLGVAGDERVAFDLLDCPDVVVEQDVGKFVADVAVGASRVVERVVDGDGPAVGQAGQGRLLLARSGTSERARSTHHIAIGLDHCATQRSDA
jgi:hypothetical protein